MAKIELDKYYTDLETAKYCIDVTNKVLDGEITHYLEPSAGGGAFSLQLPYCYACDIEPTHPSIHKRDFLTLDLPYRSGRLIIGNPPFGERFDLCRKFFRKSITIGDFVSFILPISQLNNTDSLYEFDLIHSEDLGKLRYSDKPIHCCLNIYKRPENGLNIRGKRERLRYVHIIRNSETDYESYEYDFRMCYWGYNAGVLIPDKNKRYAAEYKIKIHPKFKDRVFEVLTEVDWGRELLWIGSHKVLKSDIVKLLKSRIPEIK